MNPAAANLDGHALAARYEVLRHDVVASAGRRHTLHSLALLMRKGMAAWAAIIAGDQAIPADIEKIRLSLGLERPFIVRFGEWSWQILHGDLRTSIFTSVPVAQLIGQRIEPTLSLMIVGFFHQILGFRSVRRCNRNADAAADEAGVAVEVERFGQDPQNPGRQFAGTLTVSIRIDAAFRRRLSP